MCRCVRIGVATAQFELEALSVRSEHNTVLLSSCYKLSAGISVETWTASTECSSQGNVDLAWRSTITSGRTSASPFEILVACSIRMSISIQCPQYMVFMQCDLQDLFSQEALLSFCASLALKFADFKLDLRGIEVPLPRPHVYATIKITSNCGGIVRTQSQ
jgi:hypothetical protein